MTDLETMARVKLSLAVDNTDHRQSPYPTPWYERWGFLVALALAALVGAYAYVLVMFSLE